MDRALEQFEPEVGRWVRWQDIEPTLRGRCFSDVRSELMARRTPWDRKDDLLGALVRVGQVEEEARVAVIVCLLPGVRAAGRRFGGALGFDDAYGELVAALWARVGTYDVERRPHRVAANLLWDAVHVLGRAVRDERRWRRMAVTFDGFDVVAPAGQAKEPDPMAEAVAGGEIGQLDATLIRATRLDGADLATVAPLLGLSYEAAKKRRRRAEVAWVRWWAPEVIDQRGRVA